MASMQDGEAHPRDNAIDHNVVIIKFLFSLHQRLQVIRGDPPGGGRGGGGGEVRDAQPGAPRRRGEEEDKRENFDQHN